MLLLHQVSQQNRKTSRGRPTNPKQVSQCFWFFLLFKKGLWKYMNVLYALNKFLFFCKLASSERPTPIGQTMNSCQSQPMRASMLKSPPPLKSPPTVRQATPRPSVNQEVAVEKFSGLRLRSVYNYFGLLKEVLLCFLYIFNFL